MIRVRQNKFIVHSLQFIDLTVNYELENQQR